MKNNSVNDIINGIPNDQMESGYLEQKANLTKQLALNAAAYKTLKGVVNNDAEKQELENLGQIIIKMNKMINEIDKRLTNSSEALKS